MSDTHVAVGFGQGVGPWRVASGNVPTPFVEIKAMGGDVAKLRVEIANAPPAHAQLVLLDVAWLWIFPDRFRDVDLIRVKPIVAFIRAARLAEPRLGQQVKLVVQRDQAARKRAAQDAVGRGAVGPDFELIAPRKAVLAVAVAFQVPKCAR